MSQFYYVNLTIHVLAATLWLGGMFFQRSGSMMWVSIFQAIGADKF